VLIERAIAEVSGEVDFFVNLRTAYGARYPEMFAEATG